MLRMSNMETPGDTPLMALLKADWAAMGLSQTAFAAQHGFTNSTFTRWAQGADPEPANLARVAAALGRPAVELFRAAGYLGEPGADEPHEPSGPRYASLDLAIEHSPDLTDDERFMLHRVRTVMRRMRAGEWRDGISSTRIDLHAEGSPDEQFRIIGIAGPADQLDALQFLGQHGGPPGAVTPH
jgi:transcriptional regulator with XRE-family HTH domain